MPVDTGELDMQRRDLLKAFGAASALALLPHETVDAWARVASGLRPGNGLTDAQLAHIGAIADAIIPRTDTPSATDVNVPAFVDVIVSENYSDAERATFIDNLDAIHPDALDVIESANRREEPARTYWRLKGLIIHGYFTSEPVMKDVLKV
jgi:hypothetical protein